MEEAKEAPKEAKELACRTCGEVFKSYNGRSKHEKNKHNKIIER
jgi:hypothetical protein